MKLDGNLTGVQSYFTPSNWQQLNSGDTDFGSGGVMVLPPQQSTTPNLAVAMGKDSNLFVLNEDNLGGLGGYMQRIPAGGNGLWGGPAYFSGSKGQYVYYQTGGSVLTSYKVKSKKSGASTLKIRAKGPSAAGYGGSSPIVSSNGQNPGTGIVWLVHRNKTLTLEAYDANKVTRLLFSGAAGTWSESGEQWFRDTARGKR